MAPVRHLRYHLVVGIILIVSGAVLIARQPFSTICIEPTAAGVIIILCSFLTYSEKTAKSTIWMTAFSVMLSILLLVKITLVFFYEHAVIMQITQTKYNTLGLWSLGPIAMACVVELLLGISGWYRTKKTIFSVVYYDS